MIARILIAFAMAAVCIAASAQDTVLQVVVQRAVERKTAVQTSGEVALTLDGSVYSLTPAQDVTSWDVTLPDGANPAAFVYQAEMFFAAAPGVNVALPAEWVGFSCTKSFELSSPTWLFLQTLDDGQIACTATAAD